MGSRFIILSVCVFLGVAYRADAETGMLLSPAITRDGEQVALDVYAGNDLDRITIGTLLLITPSLLPEPTVFGGQLGWQHLFQRQGKLRSYVHPEYQLVLYRPGQTHTVRWQYGMEIDVSERWWFGQSLGLGLVREQLGDYGAWAIDGIFRLSTGFRF